MTRKIKVLLICLPLYPISMIGGWYESKDNFVQFNLKDATKDYWKEVICYLKK